MSTRKRWISVIILAAACGLVLVVTLTRARWHQPRSVVTVRLVCSTDRDSTARWSFVISNAGPAAVEWDLGHCQWTDLPSSRGRSDAFVMGGSGHLDPRTQTALNAPPNPTRSGVWRYVVPVRRTPDVLERLQGRFHRRFPGIVPAPRSAVWLATSPWIEQIDGRPSNETLQPTRPRLDISDDQ